MMRHDLSRVFPGRVRSLKDMLQRGPLVLTCDQHGDMMGCKQHAGKQRNAPLGDLLNLHSRHQPFAIVN